LKSGIGVCLLNDSFPPLIDGVSTAVVNYAEIIERSYGSSIVATPYYPGVKDDFSFPVVRYHSFDTVRSFGYRTGYPFDGSALSTINASNIDIIHSHCPIISTMLARTLRKKNDAPLVFTYHTKFDLDIANTVNGKLAQNIAIKLIIENIEACDEVWVVSQGAGDNLRSLGYRGDFIIMENGVDFEKGRVPAAELEKLSHEWSLEEGVPIFLFVGRIMWYKGLRLILDGLSSLKAAGKPFKMVFIGDGQDYDEVVAYAESLGISDECLFTGAIRDREILKSWYCRADLFLFPSNFDTNGLVVREAAACGLPSLLLRGSSAAEGVVDGRNGIIIEDNVSSMSEALLRFVSLPEKLAQIGAAAEDELYISWEDSVSRAVARYENIIERWKSGVLKYERAPFDELFTFTGDIALAFEKARAQRHTHGVDLPKRSKSRIS